MCTASPAVADLQHTPKYAYVINHGILELVALDWEGYICMHAVYKRETEC